MEKENKRREQSASMQVEATDNLPEGDEYEENPFAGKNGIELRYNLRSDEVKRGLLILQKEQIFRRNTVYTVILAALAVLYTVSLIKNPDNSMGYFMLALCAGVICIIWLTAWRFRSSQAKAVSSVTEDFNMTVYDVGILVHQENGDFRALFSEPKFVIRELEDSFLLDLNRQRIYILPKRCMEPETVAAVRERFAGNFKQDGKNKK